MVRPFVRAFFQKSVKECIDVLITTLLNQLWAVEGPLAASVGACKKAASASRCRGC